MDRTDNRPHMIVDVTDLRAGDVMLPWDASDPCGPWTLVGVDLRPLLSSTGAVAYAVDLDYGTHRTFAATGPRKIAPRAAAPAASTMDGHELVAWIRDNATTGRRGEAIAADEAHAVCFTIAAALYWLDPNAVPASWGYRAPLGVDLDSPDHEDTRELLNLLGVDLENPYPAASGPIWALRRAGGWVAEPVLVAAGNVLMRYANLVHADH